MSSNFDPDSITALLAVATLPLGVLALLFFGVAPAIAVFVVGWLLLVPVSAILIEGLADTDDWNPGHDTESDTTQSEGDAALATLRERYATGDIDEAEFERRLDALLETEDLTVESDTGGVRESDRARRGRSVEYEQ